MSSQSCRRVNAWCKQALNESDILPPATKFVKVMFLHLSVSHSVHRGVSRPRPGEGSWPRSPGVDPSMH